MIFRTVIAAILGCLAVAATPAKTAREIEERFLAPCCWAESVAFHNSPAAKEMRAEIEQFVATGKSEQEIIDYYVRVHGERILREPRGNKLVWLTVGPILAVLSGLTLLVTYMRRSRSPAAQTPVGSMAPVSEEELEW